MSLAVRIVHLLGMGMLFGGAALTWGHVERSRRLDREGSPLEWIGWRYERLFWPAAGIVVLTGVGNVGAMAPAVPGPGTDWGSTFAVKIAAVIVFLVGSMLRTALVWAIHRDPKTAIGDAAVIRVAYAATTVWLGGVVVLAVVVAHG